MDKGAQRKGVKIPQTLYGLTIEEHTLANLYPVAELFFKTPEYTELRARLFAKQPGNNRTQEEKNALLQTFIRLSDEMLKRYFFAIEIALAINDDLFLAENPIEPLAEFVKRREKDIYDVIDRYITEKGGYSIYHDPEAFTVSVFDLPEDEAATDYPQGRALSGVIPREGEPPLQGYKPFQKLVSAFVRSITKKGRVRYFINEVEHTHKTHYGIPAPISMLCTETAAKAFEEAFKRQITGGRAGIEGSFKANIGKYSVISHPEKFIDETTQNYDNGAFGIDERRVITGLYGFAMNNRYEISERERYIRFTADLDDLVREIYVCKGKSRDTIDRYKIKLYDMINRIAQRELVAIEWPGGSGTRSIEYVRIINERKFSSEKRTRGTVTLALYYGVKNMEIAVFIPHEAREIENDATLSLYTHIYTIRNQTKRDQTSYYPLQVMFKRGELITAATLTKTDETNRRQAKKILKEKLDFLVTKGYIVSYIPEEIPLDNEAEIKVTFKDDRALNSISKYAKQIEAKNE